MFVVHIQRQHHLTMIMPFILISCFVVTLTNMNF
jgi:hypothetical protein